MALGLPGVQLGGPKFITGEPLREYNFSFRLTKPQDTLKNRPGWTSILFKDLFLLYISGLAEQVNLPDMEFQLGQAQMGMLQVNFPKTFSIPTFNVQYLEDELMSVARFHMMWQESIRGWNSSTNTIANPAGYLEQITTATPGGGLQFEELGKVCCQAIYAPSKKIPVLFPSVPVPGGAPAPSLDSIPVPIPRIGSGTSPSTTSIPAPPPPPIEIPLGGEVFPYVFPTKIARGAGNRSGSNIVKTTITYARFPDISEFSVGLYKRSEIDETTKIYDKDRGKYYDDINANGSFVYDGW